MNIFKVVYEINYGLEFDHQNAIDYFGLNERYDQLID